MAYQLRVHFVYLNPTANVREQRDRQLAAEVLLKISEALQQ